MIFRNFVQSKTRSRVTRTCAFSGEYTYFVKKFPNFCDNGNLPEN